MTTSNTSTRRSVRQWRLTFRFSMATALGLITAAALFMGIVQRHLETRARIANAVTRIEERGGRILYTDDTSARSRQSRSLLLAFAQSKKVAGCDLCGVPITPEVLQDVAAFPKIESLYLTGESVNDQT